MAQARATTVKEGKVEQRCFNCVMTVLLIIFIIVYVALFAKTVLAIERIGLCD